MRAARPPDWLHEHIGPQERVELTSAPPAVTIAHFR
jgi:hypothetical protein